MHNLLIFSRLRKYPAAIKLQDVLVKWLLIKCLCFSQFALFLIRAISAMFVYSCASNVKFYAYEKDA